MEASKLGKALVSKVSRATAAGADAIASMFGYGAKIEEYPYRMLLIGETGSGKTSFLNLLCNCGMILGKHSFDAEMLRNFNDIKLENPSSHEMQSRTMGATVYRAVFDDLKMAIIDTPGFADVRGLEKDKENVQSIIDLLRTEEYINCVCLVINGRQSRMSAVLQYVLTEITAILPKSIVGNVVVMFTNTSDVLELNFRLGQLQNFLGQAVKAGRTFMIENPYCKLEKAKEMKDELPLDMITMSLKKNFEDSAEVLKRMCEVMKNFEKVYTHDFVFLYEKKQEVEKVVIDLLAEYDNQEEIVKAINRAENEAEAALRKKSLNADFTSVQKIKVIEVVITAGHNTLCRAVGCTSNCHVPCSLPKSMDKSVIKKCACMRCGSVEYCIECGHHYSYHYHGEQRYEESVKDKKFVDEVMQKKFREASTQEERARIFKERLKTERNASEKIKKELSEKLLEALEEFHKFGMARNYAKVLENQISVINLRIECSTGPETETKHLRRTKDELEKKLKVVLDTLNEPFVSATTKWARTLLELDQYAPLTEDMIRSAFRKQSRTEHPDKSGSADFFIRLERAKQTLLIDSLL